MSHVRPGRTVVLAVATALLLAAGLAGGSSRGSAGTSRSGSRAGKDGTYHTGVVAVVHAGKGYPLRAKRDGDAHPRTQPRHLQGDVAPRRVDHGLVHLLSAAHRSTAEIETRRRRRDSNPRGRLLPT
jgi:hypothetical protein